MTTILKHLALALAATHSLSLVPGVLALPDPALRANKRSAYPACTENPSDPDNHCIVNGQYLVPELDWFDPNSPADLTYQQYLPTHSFTLSQWTNGKMPERCYYWGVERDHWKPADFVMYNVTFTDCTIAPFVMCWSKLSQRNASAIAAEISRMPAPMRQAASTFMVYSDLDSDNPDYKGYFGTLAADGILIGRSKAWFPSAIIHELGHSVDSTLASPNAVHPNPGSAFSDSSTWHNAVTTDGYAISAYGAESGWADDFADVGRAVMLDHIYPGGLAAWSGNNANLTRVRNQLSAFNTVAGSYYNVGGTCSPGLKFPYPTSLVNVPTTTAPPTNTNTATPYGQCGGWTTYTGVTLCGPGYSCTSLNPYYSQCTPTPVPRAM